MELELNKIYNEDCYEGIKKIPDKSVDLIITDPPYEITGIYGSGIMKERYGKENFCKIIIDLCKTNKEMCDKEIFYINKYNAVKSQLFYNETNGGTGEDTFSGRTEESQHITRLKMGKKGKNHPFYNKHHSKEAKEKISKKLGKKVLCVETMILYNSTREVERIIGIHHENISACCRGEIKMCNGYHWKYVEEEIY